MGLQKVPIKYTKKGVTMSQLNFQINGEFLTNIARNWFWNENKGGLTEKELAMVNGLNRVYDYGKVHWELAVEK